MHFKVLEIRNLKSFGDETQRINFDDLPGVTLIMGQNNDVLDTNSRNGCGKSSILDALCFVLTGQPLKKNKKKEGLINRKNRKNAVVSLLFEHNYRGRLYEGLITRGISPTFCHFHARPMDEPGELNAPAFDRTRDSMNQTSADIIAFTGMDANVFRQVMLVAAKQPSVLEMEDPAQKSLFELIFGFQILSEKAVAIKKQRDLLERQFDLEKTRLEERKIAREQQLKQIERLEIAYAQYDTDTEAKVASTKLLIDNYETIDFKAEEELLTLAEADNTEYQKALAEVAHYEKEASRAQADINEIINNLGKDRFRLKKLLESEAETYIQQYDAWVIATNKVKQYSAEIKTFEADLTRERIALNNLMNEIEAHTDNCPTCHQTWPDQDARDAHIVQLAEQMEVHEAKIKAISLELEKLNMGVGEERLVAPPVSDVFKSRDDAVSAGATIKEIEQHISRLEEQKDKQDQNAQDAEKSRKQANADADAYKEKVTATLSKCVFKTRSELSEASRKLEALVTSLTTLIDNENPHLKTLEEARNHLPEEVDETGMIDLKKQIDHRKYLEKRLTNKNSDIRRGVMQIWLPRLNEEVYKNLEAMDLPYRLLFNDDFSVATIDSSEETDFNLVSSGEEERAIIAVALALRRVYEGIHGPINLFWIDERLDSGLDEPGAARAMTVLKEYSDNNHKSILLISHKKEMMDYADRVMLVIKEGKESRVKIL